jgi:hypothetical protein
VDWANERYVRLFVRDTTTWKLLPWQARALLPLILRKLDRAGVIDLGEDGEEGLAAMVEVPLEFVQEGLPSLLKRGVFKMAHGKFVMPNFLAAQEAKQSDAQRKRESRENQRLAAMRSQVVTDCHSSSESQAVTGCPPVSVLVTPDQTETEPDPRPAQGDPPARDLGAGASGAGCPAEPEPAKRPSGFDLLTGFGFVRSQVFPTTLPWNTARDAKGDAASFASLLSDDEVVDIKPTMRLALEHIRDGAKGWNNPRLTDPSFAFGAWKSGFHALREELRKRAPPPPGSLEARPRAKPVTPEWKPKGNYAEEAGKDGQMPAGAVSELTERLAEHMTPAQQDGAQQRA